MIKENSKEKLSERTPTKRILTKEMYARVPAMIEAGMNKEDIAREFGCKPSTLAVQCSRRRISLRKNRLLKPLRRYLGVVKVQLQDKTLQKLRSQALSKGTNDAQLVSNLIEVIVKDNLFDAVLDDPPSENIICGELKEQLVGVSRNATCVKGIGPNNKVRHAEGVVVDWRQVIRAAAS